MDRTDKILNTLLSAMILFAGSGLFFEVARGFVQHLCVLCTVLTLAAFPWGFDRVRKRLGL